MQDVQVSGPGVIILIWGSRHRSEYLTHDKINIIWTAFLTPSQVRAETQKMS